MRLMHLTLNSNLSRQTPATGSCQIAFNVEIASNSDISNCGKSLPEWLNFTNSVWLFCQTVLATVRCLWKTVGLA